MSGNYSLYILRCSDNSLYTGIARDVPTRLDEHRRGRNGAKYLRGRLPVTLVYQRVMGSRSLAQRIEHRVKRLSRARKLELIGGRLAIEQICDAHASGSSPG